MKARTVIALAAALTLASGGALAAGDAAAGKTKAQACAGCHGADGNSTNAQYPRLAGQHAEYIMSALHQYKSGERSNGVMKAMAAGLSDQDIENLAAWFSSQTCK